jgi:hypothetical protein
MASYRADPRAHQPDLLIERATRYDPSLRLTMAEDARELRASLAQPSRLVSPADLSDLAVRLTALTAAARRDEDVRRKQGERLHHLGNWLEGEIVSLREAIAKAFSGSGASIPPIKHQDGNVRCALPPAEVLVTGPPLYNDLRTLSVYMHSPPIFSL